MKTENTNQTPLEMEIQQLEEYRQYNIENRAQALERCDSFNFGFYSGGEYAYETAIDMLRFLNENYDLTPKNK